MLYKPVAIRVDALSRVLRAAGLGELHVTLADGAVWTDPDTDEAADDGAWQALSRAGLTDARGLDPDVADSLAALTRPQVEFYGWITRQDETMAVLAAKIGGDGVVAARIGSGVYLAPADPERLAEALLSYLPPVRAGRGQSITVPRSRLRNALGGTTKSGSDRSYLLGTNPTAGDVAPFAMLAKTPATGAGELYTAVRDRSTGQRRCSQHPVGYQDTVEGRWLIQVTTGNGEEWVTAVPATRDLLSTRLREAHRALSG